jgi:hypothetical protein
VVKIIRFINIKMTLVVIIMILEKCLFVSSVLNRHYISCLALLWGQNLYPKDNEIHNFGRDLPALHHHAFSLIVLHTCSFREEDFFLRIGQFWHILPRPTEPRGQET